MVQIHTTMTSLNEQIYYIALFFFENYNRATTNTINPYVISYMLNVWPTPISQSLLCYVKFHRT